MKSFSERLWRQQETGTVVATGYFLRNDFKQLLRSFKRAVNCVKQDVDHFVPLVSRYSIYAVSAP
jgi:hypothetical protein